MLFGLYNAPGTFQRCMMAIFLDMVERKIEVFMDDFFVVGTLEDFSKISVTRRYHSGYEKVSFSVTRFQQGELKWI